MSKRLAAASLGLCLAALFTSGAEARLEYSTRSHDTEAITSRNLDRNSTIYSREGERAEGREDARPAPRPPQARTRSGRSYARLHNTSRKPIPSVTRRSAEQPATEAAAATDGAATSAVTPDRAVTADHPGPAEITMPAGAHDDPEAPRSCLAYETKVLLARIEQVFGPVDMVSTCRPGAVIAGSGKPSLHRDGRAIDFDAGGRKGAIVQWLIEHHKTGGTMTYRSMSHIHVDIGPHFVSLGSGGRVASRARKARYARN